MFFGLEKCENYPKFTLKNRHTRPTTETSSKSTPAIVESAVPVQPDKPSKTASLSDASAAKADAASTPPAAPVMADCFKQPTSKVIFYKGLISPINGNVIDATREEIEQDDSIELGAYKLSEFIRDGKGGFTRFTEFVERVVPGGFKEISSKIFTNNLVTTQSVYKNGFLPIDLQVGSPVKVTMQYTTSSNISPIPPTNDEDVYSFTLVAIEPLQTIGKTFPLTCKIDRTLLTHNGIVSNLRAVTWYAPGYGIVRTDFFDQFGKQYKTLEVTRVVAEPM